jgi:hypothetical protein
MDLIHDLSIDARACDGCSKGLRGASGAQFGVKTR